MTKSELARKIDHTILKADASYEDIRKTILYAKEIGAASVCLNPAYISLAASLLKGSSTAVCTVVGFPLGANSTYTKAMEAKNACLHGAQEIDMVINITMLKMGDLDYVQKDIEAVVKASAGAIVKVILENCYLTKEEIVTGCRLCAAAGADYVKTSTGFGPSGATPEDVALMRTNIPEHMHIKAAGGIRTLPDAMALLDAGADRLGMSASAAVLAALEKENIAAAAQKKSPVKKAPAKTKKAPAKPAAKKNPKKGS